MIKTCVSLSNVFFLNKYYFSIIIVVEALSQLINLKTVQSFFLSHGFNLFNRNSKNLLDNFHKI